MNEAFQTIATDFSGSSDPAALAWPYCRWADTGTGRWRIRNGANSAWADLGPLVAEASTPVDGALFASQAWVTSKLSAATSLKVFALGSIPTSDVGPIYVEGIGAMRWAGAQYVYSGAAYGLLRVLVFTSSATYTRGAGCISGEVEEWGGGGGGTGGGTSSFNGTDLVANGGAQSGVAATPGKGGTASSTLANAELIDGGPGGETQASTYVGFGGDAPKGGAGGRRGSNLPGTVPGGGAGVSGNTYSGAGAGAYARVFYPAMPATAAVVVGAGGTAIASERFAGGNGRVIVREYGVL